MKSVFQKCLIALLAILWSVSSVQAQSVNMSRYITLTVKEGADIKLDLWADAAGTPVKIVSGNQEKTITVGKDWIGYKGYAAGAGTMTIYGNVLRFDCNSNDDNITALDISHNTELTVLYCYKNALNTLDVSHNNKLKVLYCYGNKFTTAVIDDIFCSLPDMKGQKSGEIQPALDDSSPDNNIVLAANGKNATDKNWKIRYFDDNSDITGFKGTKQCGGGVDMSRYITLTVKKDEKIHLNIWAEAADTPIKVVSGDKEQTLTVGTAWTGYRNYIAGAGSMTVYGKVLKFDCNENMENITGIDVSHNTQLEFLDCGSNSLTALDVSNNKELVNLGCGSNSLSSIDVKNNTKLEWFDCKDNSLTSLDVTKNTQLKWLGCNDNSISMLDIKNNTMLRILYCYNNSLTSLDVANNTQLQGLYCQDNNFTTEALDDIFCSLPDRKGTANGIAQLLFDASSSDKSKVLAANGSNATNKNWKVQYFGDDADITGFTGTKQCGGGSGVNMDRYITLAVDKGKDIYLSVYASADNTPIKVVSGNKEYTFNASIGWTKMSQYTAGAGTMTIYGNVLRFNCSKNGTKITGLDVGHNTDLVNLLCHENAILTLDVSKNTQLEYLRCDKNQISTIDLKNCPSLKVLICGTNTISTLDVSKNNELEWLMCDDNSIKSLDVSKKPKLTMINCQINKITSLNVSNNPKLTSLQCYDNSITSLNVAESTLLEELYCERNKIETLDISRNTALKIFDCSNNLITAIDASKNTKLTELTCYGNPLTTAALDDMYCLLPTVTGTTDYGDPIGIYPMYNSDDANSAVVLASNGKNATDKNWKIAYYESADNITGFTGTHQCGGGTGIDETKGLPSLSVYPNPVKDVLNIATDKPVHSIRIYNVYGTEVAQAADTKSINVSHLPAGVYMVSADGKVTRIIKE